MTTDLLRRLSDKRFTVGVLGLGYVGIPLAQRISEVGLPVVDSTSTPNAWPG